MTTHALFIAESTRALRFVRIASIFARWSTVRLSGSYQLGNDPGARGVRAIDVPPRANPPRGPNPILEREGRAIARSLVPPTNANARNAITSRTIAWARTRPSDSTPSFIARNIREECRRERWTARRHRRRGRRRLRVRRRLRPCRPRRFPSHPARCGTARLKRASRERARPAVERANTDRKSTRL